MLEDFKLEIDNFGPIDNACLDISKINIIAGKNASGKTTVSKLIYCILTAFSSDGKYLVYESMKDRLNNLLDESLNSIPYSETVKITDVMNIKIDLESNNASNLKTIEDGYDKLKSLIESQNEFENKKYILSMIENDKKTLKGLSSSEFHHDLLFNLFRNEFDGDEQILDNYNGCEIRIHDDEDSFEYTIEIKDAINISLENGLKNLTTNREAIYIETPYFLDFNHIINEARFFRQIPYHQLLLSNKLNNHSAKNDILDEKHNASIVNFQNKLNSLINGTLRRNSNGLFEFKQDGKTFALQNTSTGLRAIGILQILLENRTLKENSYLIMDEPEVHLHPEWQVKLAQILVLLVKELNVSLFINSHSPQFIEAIEVYSTYYGLKNETNFYLSQRIENNEKYNIKHVSQEHLYEIYDNLGNPYDQIDRIRGENLANHL